MAIHFLYVNNQSGVFLSAFSVVVRMAAGDVVDGALAVARSLSIVVRRAAGDVVDGALMQWRAPLVS